MASASLGAKIQEINKRIGVLQIALNDLVKSISEYVDEANKEIMRLRNEVNEAKKKAEAKQSKKKG